MGKKILVVDDNAEMRELLRLLFAGSHAVVTARDGRDGLAKLDQTDYDLVITDYEMPHLDGEQLASRIRRSRPALPIVMISGASQGELQTLVDAGVVDVLVMKPFAIDTLANLADRFLGRPGQAEDGAGRSFGTTSCDPGVLGLSDCKSGIA